MHWFNLGFPIAMILAPLCFTLAVRPRPRSDSDGRIARTRLLLLLAGTAAALGLFAALWVALGDVARFSWFLFFPLFFGLAMPAIVARNADWAGPHAASPTRRSASLVNRDRGQAVPRWMWAVSIGITLLAAGLIAVRPLGPTFDDAARRAMVLALALQVLCGGTLIAVLAMCMPMLRREPEPMDAGGSQELAEAYERLRRFKSRAFVWLFGVGMTAMIAVINVGVAWAGAVGPKAAMMLAIVGSVGGSLLGVGGAIIGTVAGIRRVRINGMLRELEERRA